MGIKRLARRTKWWLTGEDRARQDATRAQRLHEAARELAAIERDARRQGSTEPNARSDGR